MPSLNDIIERLRTAKSAIITAHVSPDPDAIGSSVALASLLRRQGVDAEVYLFDRVPERIQPLLPPNVRVGHSVPEHQCDVVVVVDTATRKRIGADGELLLSRGRDYVVIDHHVSNEGWAPLSYINPASSSTAEIILDIAREWPTELTAEEASLLYAGVCDDTSSFCNGNTTERSFANAQCLVKLGARPAEIASHLYYSVPERMLRLRSLALQSLSVNLDGKFAFTSISREQLTSLGADADDTEGLIDIIRSIQGVQVAAFARQIPDGWKISLRSRTPDLDVNVLAGRHGGGGHRQAAGFTFRGSLEELEPELLSMAREVLKIGT